MKIKQLILATSLLFGSSMAMAAGSYYDLDEELQSAGELIQSENYDRAIKKLKTAIDSDENNADAWNLLGYASRKNGDLDQSATAYTKALTLNPEHRDALEYQGELYLMLGDKAAAEKNLAKLQSLCPDGCDQVDVLMEAIAAQ